MIGVALKGLLGRKLRTLLTALAIVLGVSMISGTYVLTDTITKSYTSIVDDSFVNSDAVISGKSAFDLTGDSGVTAPSFSESLLQRVRSLPDVAEAQGSVNGEAHLIGKDGKAIVYGGAPNLGFSIASGESRFNPLVLVSGTWPKADEVVIDKATAGKEHFKIGQVIGVQTLGPVHRLRVSGLVKFGSVSTIGGATLSGFDLPTAQRLFRKKGQLDEVVRQHRWMGGGSSFVSLSNLWFGSHHPVAASRYLVVEWTGSVSNCGSTSLPNSSIDAITTSVGNVLVVGLNVS